MALKKEGDRLKIASTLKKDNKKFLDKLNKNTGIPISKLLDLSVCMLKTEIQNKNLLDLIDYYNNNKNK